MKSLISAVNDDEARLRKGEGQETLDLAGKGGRV